jgi:hypothetical protein
MVTPFERRRRVPHCLPGGDRVGDRERAFSLLEQAYAERDWTMRELKINLMFDPMRGDPRFARLLKKLNLG